MLEIADAVSARFLPGPLPFLINAKSTWQFISTRLLADGTQKHLLQDDFESFIWVTLYHGLHYLQHSKVGPGLQKLMPYIFDSCIDLSDGRFFGGVKKFVLLALGMKNALFAICEWRDFSDAPDTDLESELFLIFPTSCTPPIDPEMVVLRDHKALGAF
ncbi:hypothetical protein ARMSODRAFT_1011607 [Armillaria solidipes]|uniref:Fungal-type protein kinase domain-containing protein n=1 Tax=Armillaria solidipes TaxID=1076256 RepID=A0A2H3CAS3_9AGAR|nr:hypothetical protein ARMSODRAFT_1011607 [Armillaria solidipes]